MRHLTSCIILALAALLPTACYHDQHDLPPAEDPEQPAGYLTPLLEWEEQADTLKTPDHVMVTVAGINGTGPSEDFDSPQSAAEWLQQLPAGDYDLLVTADMDASHGYVLTSVSRSATRAGEQKDNTLPDMRVSLIDPASSPSQAWFGVTHATVKADEITIAEVPLQRLLSEISVIVSNVPTGAAISASVERVAHDVLLTHRDGQGRYGVADREDYMTVSLGALAADPADAATLRHDDHTLMPTAGGQPRCYLTLSVTTPEGTRLTYLADAPRMECGKTYVVELDYTKLRPYMLLEAFTINDWTEGWTISGEIINPDRGIF